MSMSRLVRFSSAPCGAGKTFQIARKARQMVMEGKNALILQPTKLLIEKTKVEEFDQGAGCPPIRIFHNGTVGNHVGRQLADYLADPEDQAQIVMATHQVMTHIPYLANANDWHVMFDECPQVDRECSHNIQKTHNLLTEHIGIEQYDGIYGKISVVNLGEVKRLARNEEEDDLVDELQETAAVLINPHWESFVNVEQYHKLLAGRTNTLTFHSVLKPSIVNGFASVFITAANVEDSAIYHLWGKRGVRFKADEDFTDKLRFRSHPNGHLATIHYALETNWSRNLLEKETAGIPNLNRMRDASLEIVGSQQFLWQANKSVPDNFMSSGKRLPHNSLGLNGFSDVHNIVFMSALNPSPAHGRFLKAQGLSPAEIDRMGYCSIGYQAMMRTSLRDTSNLVSKNIVVTDERLARYLGEMLPGATLRKFESGIADETNRGGRPRRHKDNAAKARQYRERQKEARANLLAEMFACNRPQDNSEGSCDLDSMTNKRNETTISINSGFVTGVSYYATLYSTIKTAMPAGYLQCGNSDDFILAMATFHEQKHEIKGFNKALFSSDL